MLSNSCKRNLDNFKVVGSVAKSANDYSFFNKVIRFINEIYVTL